MASCCMPGQSSWLCSRAPLNWTLGPTVQGAFELWPFIMQYELVARETVVNIMAQGLSTPDPSLSPTHLSIRRGRATTTQYTLHQVSLMVSCNTTLVPSLGLRIGPACQAGLSAGMRREHVPPQIRKKERKKRPVMCRVGR